MIGALGRGFGTSYGYVGLYLVAIEFVGLMVNVGFCLILVCCLFWFYTILVVICNNMVNLSFCFWVTIKSEMDCVLSLCL